jgi:hypothetical protein
MPPEDASANPNTTRDGTGRGFADALENCDRALIVPVVQDRAQEVGVCTPRDAVEETAAEHLATGLDPARLEKRWCARHHVREIE